MSYKTTRHKQNLFREKDMKILGNKAFIRRKLHKHKLVLFVWNRKVIEKLKESKRKKNIKGVYNQEKLYY